MGVPSIREPRLSLGHGLGPLAQLVEHRLSPAGAARGMADAEHAGRHSVGGRVTEQPLGRNSGSASRQSADAEHARERLHDSSGELKHSGTPSRSPGSTADVAAHVAQRQRRRVMREPMPR